MDGLSKYIFYELSKSLSLKNIIKLSGVCKETYRKIRYKNASGIYICLRKKNYLSTLIYEECGKEKPSVDVIKVLLDSGIDIETSGSVYQYTPLMLSLTKDISVIKTLLDAGADVNRTNYEGESPLRLSLLSDVNGNRHRPQVTQMLIKYGGDVDEIDNFGLTLVDKIIQNNMKPMHGNELSKLKLLVKNGFDLDKKNGDDKTPLMTLILVLQLLRPSFRKDGYYQLLYYIIEESKNIDQQDFYGYTALMNAAADGLANVVKILLEKGADPNIQNNMNEDCFGQTALMLVFDDDGERPSTKGIITSLIRAGADMNIIDNNGKTALDYANTSEKIILLNVKLPQ